MDTEVTAFDGGVWMEQHGCVLSKVLAQPGPTHSVFDVLAAAVVAFSPGLRVAMLGFAGGGMMAPLRKLGGDHAVEAVDLDPTGHGIYREVGGDWGGDLEFVEGDAVAWLRGQRRCFDAIVEDLSVPVGKDVVKPSVSWEELPPLMARRVRSKGVVISNLLPTPGMTMLELEHCIHRLGPACVVELDRFHNRILLQGAAFESARETGRQLRGALNALGSRLADEISLRKLAPIKS
jgi:hypothetical protein